MFWARAVNTVKRLMVFLLFLDINIYYKYATYGDDKVVHFLFVSKATASLARVCQIIILRNIFKNRSRLQLY